MQRISTASAIPDLHGPGRPGFTDGDPVGGIPPTFLNAQWFNSLQEEVLNVIEASGQTPSPDDLQQLLKALALLAVQQSDFPVRGFLTAPPVDPASGDRYAVRENATGEWAGQGGRVATWSVDRWRFATPLTGTQANFFSGGVFRVLYSDGVSWQEVPGAVPRLVAAAGTANAWIVTPAPAFTSYDGMWLIVRAAVPNTGSVTINVNGLGVRGIRDMSGDQLEPSDVISGQPILIAYDTAANIFRAVSLARKQLKEACLLGVLNNFTLSAATATEPALGVWQDTPGWKSGAGGILIPEAGLYQIQLDFFAQGNNTGAFFAYITGTGSDFYGQAAQRANGDPLGISFSNVRPVGAGVRLRPVVYFTNSVTIGGGNFSVRRVR